MKRSYIFKQTKYFFELFRWYGAAGFLRLIFSVIYTKLFYPEARLIRLPCYIRSKHKIIFKKGFTTGVGFRLDVFENAQVFFGENVQINDYVHIAVAGNIQIGKNCLIASRVFISDHNHGNFKGNRKEHWPSNPPLLRPLDIKDVVIGDNVWIGEGVFILPGVSIGFGSVIGAGSVVTKDVPAASVVVGSPAKVIRYFDPKSKKWNSCDD